MRGWSGGCRENHNNSGGLLYHLGVGGHVAVFQGIDGAHYTVLTVVGGGLGSHTKRNTQTRTHTHIRITRLQGNGGGGGGRGANGGRVQSRG